MTRLRDGVGRHRDRLLVALALLALTSCAAHVLVLGHRAAAGILATAVVAIATTNAIESA